MVTFWLLNNQQMNITTIGMSKAYETHLFDLFPVDFDGDFEAVLAEVLRICE